MKKFFRETVVRETVEPINQQHFIDAINHYKPEHIWHSDWSASIPFIVIKDYNENGFMVSCNGWADKTQVAYTAQDLYNFLRVQGLQGCYLELVEMNEASQQSMPKEQTDD